MSYRKTFLYPNFISISTSLKINDKDVPIILNVEFEKKNINEYPYR